MAANVSNNSVNLPTRNTQPTANNTAANVPDAASSANDVAAAAAPAAAEHHKGGNQVMGFFEGFVKEGVDTVGGLYTLVTTNPITTAKGLVYMACHPIKTGQAIVEPYTTALKEGNYGEFVGRVSFQALTIAITSGALTKSGKGAEVGSKAAGETGKAAAEGSKVAAETGNAAAGAGTAAATESAAAKTVLTGAQAEEAGAAKAMEQMLAKHPKLTADALKNMIANNEGSVVYRNEYRALAARFTAEAGGLSAETLDALMKTAGHLPKADVFQYINSAAAHGMSEADISANLAKFAGQAGGKDALRAAAKGMADAATTAPVADATKVVEDATQTATKTAAPQTVGQYIDGGINSVKKSVDNVSTAFNDAVDTVRQTPETIAQAARDAAKGVTETVQHSADAVKNVYNASITVGQVADGIVAVPRAIGRGIGTVYDHTLGKLVDGIRNISLVNPFHMPDWQALASKPIPYVKIALSPITLPVKLVAGTVGLAFTSPVKFLGAAALTGDVGVWAKKGELVSKGGGFKEYALKQGDTLESIAQQQLGDAARWPEIYKANKELFDSLGPDSVLQPGTKLLIPTGGAASASSTTDAPATGDDPTKTDAPAADSPAASTTSAADAGAYKEGLLKLIDEKSAGTDPDTQKVLDNLKKRLASMSPEDVYKLKPQLEEQGLKVEIKPAASNGPTPAPAPKPPAAPTTTPAGPSASAGIYTVQKNDSLWTIAQRQLGDANKWREIVKLNKDQYPSLETNPDFIQVGWKLKVSSQAASANSTAASKPPAKPPAQAQASSVPQPTAAQRQQIVMQFGLEPSDENWNNFWSEVSSYPKSAIGPDTGSPQDVKALQGLLNKFGFQVPTSGSYYELNAAGNPVSPTAEAVIAFKKLAGITQSYNVLGTDGKPTPEVNEYVDARTSETMQVALRLLQNPAVRTKANMEAAVKEAANLQEGAIGPDTGSKEGRAVVQQYLGALQKVGQLGQAPVKVTGEFDQATTDALIEFKKKNNLAASYKDDKGNAVYTPYVDGPTAEALYQAAQQLKTK